MEKIEIDIVIDSATEDLSVIDVELQTDLLKADMLEDDKTINANKKKLFKSKRKKNSQRHCRSVVEKVTTNLESSYKKFFKETSLWIDEDHNLFLCRSFLNYFLFVMVFLVIFALKSLSLTPPKESLMSRMSNAMLHENRLSLQQNYHDAITIKLLQEERHKLSLPLDLSFYESQHVPLLQQRPLLRSQQQLITTASNEKLPLKSNPMLRVNKLGLQQNYNDAIVAALLQEEQHTLSLPLDLSFHESQDVPLLQQRPLFQSQQQLLTTASNKKLPLKSNPMLRVNKLGLQQNYNDAIAAALLQEEQHELSLPLDLSSDES